MATMKGKSEVSQYFGQIEKKLERLLRDAGRAGGRVIAEEAKRLSVSDQVADAITVSAKSKDHRVSVRVSIEQGWVYSLATWQEYGTTPHFISVDDEQRAGLGLRKINQKVAVQLRTVGDAERAASLVIGGKFVGDTVLHPGATRHPFLRPALDIKMNEAAQAAQAYIDARISRRGITNSDEGDNP